MTQPRVIAGRFEIGAFIDHGGMGEVYRGLDLQTGQVVAIKTLRPAVSADPGWIERFAREGEALRQLNHPNIVQVLATVEEESQHYIITEYVAGGSLRKLLEAQPQLPTVRVLEIALELADALTRAHHLGIIHRDIKPDNVLLDNDDKPRLTDFGLARVGESNLTETGAFVGTIGYLSPEACQGEVLDARADIWAFGVMLFEMLAGRLPFEEDNLGAAILAILTQPTPDLEALRPDAPLGLVDLIYRTMTKHRETRISSMRLVGAELEAIIHGLDIAPSTTKRWSAVGTASHFAAPTPVTEAPKHNLPTPIMPFIGRKSELVQLANLLADPKTRLVTILGPGGMGKTHLALEAAASQLNNFQAVYFVPLAPLNTPENIVPAVANAVKYRFQGNGREPKRQLFDYLRAKRLLLVMDNCEHLLSCAELVNDILQVAPDVKVIATSRVPLNLQGEIRFRIEGLDFPDLKTWKDAADHANWARYGAVKLFIQSARRVMPSFAPEAEDWKHAAHICYLVEGMPLGILLAAGWMDMLSLQEIAAEISQSLDFLETEIRDLPERHRSIRAVFKSTWNQLTDSERDVMMKLSVFRGGFMRDAAQRVTGARLRTLRALVEKSLLWRNRDTGHYEIHELLRQYAEEQLGASGRADAVRDVHCEYYLVTLHQREVDLKGHRPAPLAGVDVAALPVHTTDQLLIDPLTKRELEVLRLIADGLSNQEIADQLFVAVSTIKKHINRMYSKLGVERRTQAIVRARELKLL